ncbi:MAG: hypothetical protein OXC00_04915 [Acidimicrobiaceae bacterium]|nr:hypothetical protein [Acidimicrobiaceae bacterium]
MIWRTALSVTWRGDRATVARNVVVALAAAAVTLVACATTSTVLMVHGVNERAATRAFQPVEPGETADLSTDVTYDSIRGEQIFVHYWRIQTDGVTIPGVPPDATVGDWFVSPELQQRIGRDPLLAGRFPEARTLGDDGIGSADELVAYRLVGPEADLRWSLTNAAGSEHIGLDAGVTVVDVVIGGTGLVVVFGTGLLRTALGPVSTGLRRRLTLLHALGAARAVRQLVAAAGIAISTAPAAVAAALAWYVVAPRLQAVPLVGQRVLPGDLGMPAWTAAVVAAIVVVLAAAAGATRGYSRVGSRPTSRIPQPPARWRLAPLAASIGLIAYSVTQTGEAGVRLFVSGVFAASVGVIFALPVLIGSLGAALARGGSVIGLLAGRRLSWDAGRSARPLTALVSLAVIVPVAASYVAVARSGDPAPPPSTISAISVNGDLEPEAMGALQDDADGVFVDVYRIDAAVEPRTLAKSMRVEAPRFVWVADCDPLSAHVPLESCASDGIVVAPGASGAFARLDAGTTTVPEGGHLDHRLFITRDGEGAERILRSYAVNSDGDMSVFSNADNEHSESRSVRWIISAIQLGTAGAFAALLLSVVTSASRSAATRVQLLAVGARASTIRRLAASESAVTVAAVGLGGVAVGTVGAVAYTLVDGARATNFWPSLVIAASVLVAAAVSAAASAVYVTGSSPRSALRTRD